METEARKVESSWSSSKIHSENSEWMVENVKGNIPINLIFTLKISE